MVKHVKAFGSSRIDVASAVVYYLLVVVEEYSVKFSRKLVFEDEQLGSGISSCKWCLRCYEMCPAFSPSNLRNIIIL